VKLSDIAMLLALGAIWGSTFLFLRITAPEFGPAPLTALRVIGATLMLLPMVAWQGQLGVIRAHWRRIALVGLANTAVPFTLFGFGALWLDAALLAIINSTAPIWTALIAALWLGERITPRRLFGLVLGFGGVALLVWPKVAFAPGQIDWSALGAASACMAAAACYGFAAVYTARALPGANSVAIATGSVLASSIVLMAPLLLMWPVESPSPAAWSAMVPLSLMCTGLGYLLYFRLLARLGPAGAIGVAYLFPVFAALWAALFLGEQITLTMVCAGVLILTGVWFSRRDGKAA
jgi:drug/metabolite transporter (DMT)-like permease